MPIPIRIPDRPDAIYLAVLLLAAAVSLVIATRAITITHADPVKFTVPAYVGLTARFPRSVERWSSDYLFWAVPTLTPLLLAHLTFFLFIAHR